MSFRDLVETAGAVLGLMFWALAVGWTVRSAVRRRLNAAFGRAFVLETGVYSHMVVWSALEGTLLSPMIVAVLLQPILIVWLLLRPGLRPTMALVIYHVVSLVALLVSGAAQTSVAIAYAVMQTIQIGVLLMAAKAWVREEEVGA